MGRPLMTTIEEFVSTTPEVCCGCAACADICPARCIEMKPNDEGFLYPVIDRGRCLSCGACARVCPSLNVPRGADEDPVAFAFVSRDENSHFRSSSGGFFQKLATHVLAQGGVVYGAGVDGNWNVVHKRTETAEQVRELMGSKYVQSRTVGVCSQVCADLDAGLIVLFSGTPCQCAGVKNFCGGHERLLISDIVCHGVPSPFVWRHYLDLMSEGRAVAGVSFRDKDASSRTPWESYGMRISFTDGSYLRIARSDDAYLHAFLSDLILRPSCACCRFKQIRRAADFTLADFWGVKNVLPEAYDKNGTSLVLLHTPRAREIFAQLDGVRTPAPLQAALSGNPSMTKSVTPSPYRTEFFQRFKEGSTPIDELLDFFTYRDNSAFRRLKRRLARTFGRTKQIRNA